MKTATEHLIKHGIKPSVQRVAIMQYLLTHKTHPTVEEIYSALVPNIPTLSKTTVYNTLRLLADSKATLWLNIEDREVRFDGDVSNHMHFKCRKCGRVFDFRTSDLPEAERVYGAAFDGFAIDDVQINMKGICAECKKKEKLN